VKQYFLILLTITTLAILFISSLLIFTKVNNYSDGAIVNDNSVNYLATKEARIYLNQKKEISINNEKIIIQINSKVSMDNIIMYGFSNINFTINSGDCKIKMNQQSLIWFIYKSISKK